MEGSKGLKAAKEHRTWHLYVRNLDRYIKTDDACDHLKENGVKVFTSVSLSENHCYERQAFFHVEVYYESKDNIMQGSLWSKEVKIRNWSFLKSSIW